MDGRSASYAGCIRHAAIRIDGRTGVHRHAETTGHRLHQGRLPQIRWAMCETIHLLLGGTAESNAAAMVERSKEFLVSGLIHFDFLGVGAGFENAWAGSMAFVLA